MSFLTAAILTALLLHAPARAHGQESAPSREDQLRSIEQDPIGQMGVRSRQARARLPVVSTLVIVKSTDDYLRALSRWQQVRFPVLIDDGSPEAVRRIGQFVRGFQPASIIRFEATDEEAARNPDELREMFRAGGRQDDRGPVGVMVASEGDQAWTGAAALSLAYDVPLLWIDDVPRGRPGNVMSPEAADALDATIESAMTAADLAWRDVRDVDLVGVCLNAPARVKAEKGHLALTDVLGRRADGARYAFCSQVLGDASEAAWMAMCSLFLHAQSAWLYDGYDRGFAPPYDLAKSHDILSRSGWEVTLDGPAATTLTWRGRVAAGVDAAVIHVNTKGHAHWFDVGDGRLYASEIPLLRRPAIVHFIHSFSAQRLNDQASIARRWLDVGTYAYVGSVHEPMLQAFLPGEIFMNRIASGFVPFAAAARQDHTVPWAQSAWKIHVIGDPMLVSAPLQRVEAQIAGRSLSDVMQAAIRDRDFETAITSLVMLNRGDDAAALAASLHAEAPEALSQRLVQLALPSVFAAGDRQLFSDLYLELSAPASEDPLLVDLLWQLHRRDLGRLDEQAAAQLRSHVRDTSVVEDAKALAPDLRRLYGEAVVRGFITELIERTDDQRVKRKLREVE